MILGNRRKVAHGSSRGVVLLVLTRFFGKKAVVVVRWKTVTGGQNCCFLSLLV